MSNKAGSAVPYIVLQLLVLAVGAILIAENSRPGSEVRLQPEAMFALVLVFGVVLMMTTLFVLAAGFSQLNLADNQQALGLPIGSVRALIALILILIFIMFGVFLYLQESAFGTVDKTGKIEMPQDAWVSLPNVYSAERIGKDEPARYAVELTMPYNERSSDLAQQLLTTVGTLVVAVAGFYFGSSTAASEVVKKYAGAMNGSKDDAASDDEAETGEESEEPAPDEDAPSGGGDDSEAEAELGTTKKKDAEEDENK